MNIKCKILFLLLFLFLPGALNNLKAAEVDIDFFYDKLAPYGEWFEVAQYGWVWSPYEVNPGWQPYTDGQWVYTDWGWTFISDDDWGWAVYHYGRWVFSDDNGWLWIPGNVWGPAWVCWRFGDSYLGWAPLPPDVIWSDNQGLIFGSFDIDTGIPWYCWSFIDVRRFNEPHIKDHLEDQARNVNLIGRCRNVTSYKIMDRRIINNNLNISDFEKIYGRKIPEFNISEAKEFNRSGKINMEKRTIELFRPEISKRKTAAIPKNILPERKRNTPEDIQKQYESKTEELNRHYENRMDQLKTSHENENRINKTRSIENRTPENELTRRHDSEIKSLNEQHNRENHIISNRQNREIKSLHDSYQKNQDARKKQNSEKSTVKKSSPKSTNKKSR